MKAIIMWLLMVIGEIGFGMFAYFVHWPNMGPFMILLGIFATVIAFAVALSEAA